MSAITPTCSSIRPRYLEPAHPGDDRRVSLTRQPGDGSNSGETCLIDETSLTYKHSDYSSVDLEALDHGAKVDGTVHPPATLVSGLPERQWRLHYDLGHDRFSKRTVRRTTKYRRADAILDSLEVPEWARQDALRRVMSENLNRWSRHEGADGAVVGFVSLVLFECEEDAQSSWVAERAAEVVPGLSKRSVRKLLQYAFRRAE